MSRPPTKIAGRSHGSLGGTAMAATSSASSSTSSSTKVRHASSSHSSHNSHNSNSHSHSSHGSHSTSASSAAPSHTQRYREILIARTDGVGYSTQQINDASRSAQPVGDPLPDSHDYVRSWTVKLGKAIKYNLGARGSSADHTSYLVRLPKGYALHVRSHKKEKDKDGKTTTGTTAARPSQVREGPFVFGHPLGPIAAFRSPAELALHVLWLLSDSTARADCSCRLCVRMVAEEAAITTAVLPGPEALAQTPIQPPVPPQFTPAPAPAAVPAPSAVAPAPAPPAPPAPPPNILPTGGGAELFRPWELVWYQHMTAQFKGAWRLGIVLQLPAPGAPTTAIRVAPLGVPGQQPPPLDLPPVDLRPFLSFSVPAMREGFQGLAFEAVNWAKMAADAAQRQAQQQGPAGQSGGNGAAAAPDAAPTAVALEASKAAANQINGCFSVANARPKAAPAQCVYDGVFLGAELILVGDAIRVDAEGAGDETTRTSDIMRVTLILTDHGHLRFLGDVYRLAQTTAGPAAGPTAASTEAPPPGRVFAEEIAERNGISARGDTANHTQWHWHLQERNANRAEAAVHGRFYASTRLAANLQHSGFLAEAAAGRVGDAMVAALNRRPQVGGFRYEGQRATRAATIGAAIGVALPAIGGLREGV